MVAEIDLILNAFAAGAGTVGSALATDATRTACTRLTDLLRRRLDGREVALAELDRERPRREVLRSYLTEAGAATDRDLHDAAQRVITLTGAGHGRTANFWAEHITGAFVGTSISGPVVFGGSVTYGERGQSPDPQTPAAIQKGFRLPVKPSPAPSSW